MVIQKTEKQFKEQQFTNHVHDFFLTYNTKI